MSISEITFTFDKIKTEQVKDFVTTEFSQTVKDQHLFDKQYDTLLFASQTPNSNASPFGHGLLGTMFQAYSHHIPLVLRPDDLWTSICFAFSKYVEMNSEKMRHLFVSHAGKEKITIRIPNLAEKNFPGYVNQFATELKKKTKNEVIEWLTPDFTTTTPVDVTVCQISIMNAMKNYFSFGMETLCGLSKVTLKGTLADWESLVEKAKKLSSYDLDDWRNRLILVLEQFLSAYKGTVDETFWQTIINRKSYGSGSSKITGWALVLCPFDKKGQYIWDEKREDFGWVDCKDVMQCSCQVPVEIDDNGTLYDSIFFAGQLMTRYKDGALSPQSGYAMIVKNPVTYENMKEEVIKIAEKCLKKAEEQYQKDILELEKIKLERREFYLKKAEKDLKRTPSVENSLKILDYKFFLIKKLNIANDTWMTIARSVLNMAYNIKEFTFEAYCKNWIVEESISHLNVDELIQEFNQTR